MGGLGGTLVLNSCPVGLKAQTRRDGKGDVIWGNPGGSRTELAL